jgi:hypothetical protein
MPIRRLRRALGRDLRSTALEQARSIIGHREPPDATPVTEADLADLPEPARRYLRFMGVIGRARDWSFQARFRGRFRRGRGQWMRCDAWQFDSVSPITRVFHMRIDFAGFLPMVGRDVYAHGRGSMKGSLVGMIKVADGEGVEFDIGELTTYVNDALLLAPSMLLVPSTTWSPVDDGAFDVTVADAGHTVTGRVFVDEIGAIRDFETTDRFCDLPDGMQRARWTTPVEGWTTYGGRPLPTRCGAIWHLDDGPLPYIEGVFVPGSVTYNRLPAP